MALIKKSIGLDPGTEKSGICIVIDNVPVYAAKLPNIEILALISAHRNALVVAIEGMQHYKGCPAGNEVFQAIRWGGRFEERAHSLGIPSFYYTKPDWARSLVGRGRKITDAGVRTALELRFGGYNKGQPLNVLKGNSDMRSACGVILYHLDIMRMGQLAN